MDLRKNDIGGSLRNAEAHSRLAVGATLDPFHQSVRLVVVPLGEERKNRTQERAIAPWLGRQPRVGRGGIRGKVFGCEGERKLVQVEEMPRRKAAGLSGGPLGFDQLVFERDDGRFIHAPAGPNEPFRSCFRPFGPFLQVRQCRRFPRAEFRGCAERGSALRYYNTASKKP